MSVTFATDIYCIFLHMTNENVRSQQCAWFGSVTSRLKGKALLVNYHAKRDHRKITSSPEVNIFSFFSALGGSANSEGPELPLPFSALEFSSTIPRSTSLSLFLQAPCLHLHSFSYNIITCSEGKCEQKLSSNFLTD